MVLQCSSVFKNTAQYFKNTAQYFKNTAQYFKNTEELLPSELIQSSSNSGVSRLVGTVSTSMTRWAPRSTAIVPRRAKNHHQTTRGSDRRIGPAGLAWLVASGPNAYRYCIHQQSLPCFFRADRQQRAIDGGLISPRLARLDACWSRSQSQIRNVWHAR